LHSPIDDRVPPAPGCEQASALDVVPESSAPLHGEAHFQGLPVNASLLHPVQPAAWFSALSKKLTRESSLKRSYSGSMQRSFLKQQTHGYSPAKSFDLSFSATEALNNLFKEFILAAR
jgi:hypothetical protein